MEQSIKTHLNDVIIKTASFTNDRGEVVNYRQLILSGVLNGNQKQVVLKGLSQSTIDLIEAFSDLSPDLPLTS